MKRALQRCVIILIILAGGYVVAVYGFEAVARQVVQARAGVDARDPRQWMPLPAIGF